MATKDSPKDINDKSWKAKIETQIHEEYKEYLKATGQNGSPNSAHLFAMKKISESGGHNYKEYTESQLILLLEGKPPEFY